MEFLVTALSWFFLLTGAGFGIIGAIGMLRFPDFYTRLHAASLTDTLCAGLIVLGLMLQAGWTLITVKLLFILVFIFFTSPTSSHALAKAALHGKLEPLLNRGSASSNS